MNRLTALMLAMLAASPALIAAPAAQAQLTNSSSPVSIAADHNNFQANQCVTHYSGNVEVLQDDRRLRSDDLDVYAKMKGAGRGGAGDVSCGETDHIVAKGAVYFVTPTQVVKGDEAVYNADARTIVFTGQVVVAEGKNVTAGDRLLIHTDSREGTMESNATGRGQPGRVHAVIYPKSSQGGAPSPAGLQPPRPPPARQPGA